jgi:WD40 repeat protein
MQRIRLPDKKDQPRALGFSAEGRWLIAWDNGKVFVLDTASGTVHAKWGELIRPTAAIGHTGAVSAVPGVGFTSDGQPIIGRLVYARDDGPKFHVHDVNSGAVRRALPAGDVRAGEVGPGGRFVYLAFYAQGIARCDPLTGKASAPFGKHKEWPRCLAVSADEKWIAGLSEEPTYTVIRVWSLSGKKLPTRAARQFKPPAQGRYSGLALSSDGAFVAYTMPGVNVIDVKTGDTRQVVPESGGLCKEVAFRPSRPVLAYSGGTEEVTLYDVKARTELMRYAGEAGEVCALAFSADGMRCAAASPGHVVIWDVDA